MTSTELGYLSGVTSNIQDQLNGKANTWTVTQWIAHGASSYITIPIFDEHSGCLVIVKAANSSYTYSGILNRMYGGAGAYYRLFPFISNENINVTIGSDLNLWIANSTSYDLNFFVRIAII